MADLYKSSDEAGTEVRRRGQGIAYVPGAVYKERTGLDYKAGDIYQNGIPDGLIETPQRRQAIASPDVVGRSPSSNRPSTQEEIDFLNNAIAQANEQVTANVEKAGFLELVKEGAKSTLASSEVGVAMTTGSPEKMVEKAGLITQEIKRQQALQPREPEELKKLKESAAAAGEEWKNAEGFVEKAGAVGTMLSNIGKALVNNKTGIMYMTGEQLANMAPAIVGAWAGMKTGAATGAVAGMAFPPAAGPLAAGGGVAGGLTGAFALGSQVEKGSEFVGTVVKALAEMKVPVTEENVKALLENPEFFTKAYEASTTKGNVTAGVDAAFTVATGGIASGARRAAVKQALAELPRDATEQAVKARVGEILSARSLTAKVGRPVAAGATSVVGDAASEAGGAYAAYGEVDLGDVQSEILGGIGGSVVEVPLSAKAFYQEKIKPALERRNAAMGDEAPASGTGTGATGTQTSGESAGAPEGSNPFAMSREDLTATAQSVQGQRILAGLYAISDEPTRASLDRMADSMGLPVDLFALSQQKGVREFGLKTYTDNPSFVQELLAATEQYNIEADANQEPRMTVRDRLLNQQLNAQEDDGQTPLTKAEELEYEIAKLKGGREQGELTAGPGELQTEDRPSQDVLIRGYQRAALNLDGMPPAAQRASAISSMEQMRRDGFSDPEINGLFGRFLEDSAIAPGIEVTEVQDIDAASVAPTEADPIQSAGFAPNSGTITLGTGTTPNVSERLQTYNKVVPAIVASDNNKWGVPSTANDYAPAPLTPALYQVAKAFGVNLVGFKYRGNNKLVKSRAGISTPNGIALNTQNRAQFLTVFGHEVYHSLRRTDPEAARLLEQEILSYISEEGKAAFRAKLEKVGYNPSKFDEEMTADVMGLMFREREFWQELSVKQPTLLQKVISVIDNLISKFGGTSSRKDEIGSYITDMQAVRQMLVDFTSQRLEAANAPAPAAQPVAPAQPAVTAEQRAQAKQAVADAYKQAGASDGLVKDLVDRFQKLVNENNQPTTLWQDAEGNFDQAPAGNPSPLANGREVATLYPEQANQAEPVEVDAQDQIDGDPIDNIKDLAKAGKKMEAAKVFRAASLYQQLGVPFEKFYADALAEVTPKQEKAEPVVNADVEGNVGSTVKQVAPNTFQGTVTNQVAEPKDVSPKKLTAKEKAAQTRAANEALVSGQFSEDIAVRAIGIKAKTPGLKADLVSRALVDGEPVALLYKTDNAKYPYARINIAKDGTFNVGFGPNENVFAKLPDGAEVVSAVKRNDEQGQGNLNLSENRSLENKYKSRAQRIMLYAFTRTQTASTLKNLRKQIAAEFERQKPFFKFRKPKSDVQYIFDQFASVGAMESTGVTPTKIGFDRLSGERVEVEKGGSKGYLQALTRAVQAAQEGDIKARAGLFKVHATRIQDSLLGLRAKMAESGLSDQTIDSIIQPHLESIDAILTSDGLPQMETNLDSLADRVRNLNNLEGDARNAEIDAIIALQNTIKDPEAIETGNEVDDISLPLDNPDYSDRRKSAAAAIDEAKKNKTSPMVMLRRESLKANPEFTFSDLRAEMAAQGMEVSALDREVAQWPAAQYTLDYWVNKHMTTMGAYNARVAWYDSHERLMRIYADDAAMRDRYESELSGDEREFIADMRQQEKDAKTRLQEKMRKVTAGDSMLGFEPHETPEDAFPHALFNRYGLSELRNFDDSNIPENEKRILRSLVNGQVNLLPGLWMSDLGFAITARRDLTGQIMNGLTKSEQAAFKAYQEARDAELANPIAMSERRTYSAQLAEIKGLDKGLYDTFAKQLAYANVKAIPTLLQYARTLADISQSTKDRNSRNLAMSAYLDQVYHNDEIYSTTLAEGAPQFRQIEGRDQIPVTEGEVDSLIEYSARMNRPIPTREQAREMVLFTKLAEMAAKRAEQGIVEETGYTPEAEEVADPNADLENQVGLSGDIQYKRGRYSGSTTQAAVAEHIQSITADWESQPNVTVLENVSQVEDPAVYERLTKRDPSGQFSGAIDPETGAVYMFSDYMMGLDDAEFTLFHELYGHWGLRAFLGDKLNTFLKNQYRLNQKVKAEADRQFDAALDTENPMSRVESIEEAISDIAANGDPSLFRQLMGQLVSWLRKHNMNSVADWIDSKGSFELAAVLAGARKAVRNGEASPLQGAPDDVLYSRQSKPVELFAIRDDKTTGYARLNPALNSWTVFTLNDPETNTFDSITVESAGDAMTILKKFGKVSKSKERSTREAGQTPANWNRIPDFNDVAGWSKIVRDKAIRHQNGYRPVFEVAEYLQSKGVENTVADDLVKFESRAGYIIDGYEKKFIRPIMNLLREIGKKGGTVEDVQLFLYARHAPERNEYIQTIDPKNPKGSGMATDRAEKLLATNNKGAWDSYASELDAFGQIFDEMSRVKLNYMLQTGQITPFQYESLSRYKHYVTLSGNQQAKEEYDTKIVRNRAFVLKSPELKRSTGRGTEAVGLIENTINSFFSSILRGQQNRPLNAILDMHERSPDPTFVQIEPEKERKQVNVERIKFDKMILKYLSDTPTERAGRKYMKELSEAVAANEMTTDEALADLMRRINAAEREQFISPQDATTAIRRLNEAVVESGRLSPEGYVTMVADPTLMTEDNVIVAKRGGVPIVMRYTERGTEFVQALTGLNATPAGAFVEFSGAVNRWLGQLLTSYNPAWILPNMYIDAQTLVTNATADPKVGGVLAAKMGKELPTAVKQAFFYTIAQQAINNDSRWGKILQRAADRFPGREEYQAMIAEYLEEGGGTFFLDRNNLEQTLDKLDRHLGGPKNLLDRGQNLTEGLENLMALLGNPSELGPRIAAYKVLREAGWSKAEAARYGKEITVNFNMKGSEKWLRSLFLFANPSIQGTVRMFKDYSASKDGAGRFLPSKRFATVAAGFMVLGMLSSLIGRAVGGEDEEKPGIDKVDRLPLFKRNSSFIITPDVYGASIPIAHGWRAFFATGVHMFDAMTGRIKPEVAAQRITAAAADTLLPIGAAADSKDALTYAAKAASPTLFVPIVELIANEGQGGAPIYKKDGAFTGVQESNAYSHYDSVNPISRSIAHSLAKLTSDGNPRYSAGLIDINPAIMDHLVRRYLPGLPADAYKLGGILMARAEGRDTKDLTIPIADRFLAKSPDKFDLGAMRRVSEAVETKYAEAMSNDTSPERKAKIMAEHPQLAQMAGLMRATDKQLRKLSADLKNIESNRLYTDEYKVQARNYVEQQKMQFYNRVATQAVKSGFRDEVIDAVPTGLVGKISDRLRK